MSPGAPLRLHLVRHGETLFNVRHQLQGWCDSPLTARGRRQIAALGAHLRDVPLVAAFTSDLLRTRETAAGALAGHPSLEAVPSTDLREWCFGGWEGLPNPALWEPLFARLGEVYGDSAAWGRITARGLDGLLDGIAESDELGMAENAAAVRERAGRAVAMLTGAVPGGDVLVVTHGAYIQSLLRELVPGVESPAGFPNCGIATVEVQHGDARLVGVDARCAVA